MKKKSNKKAATFQKIGKEIDKGIKRGCDKKDYPKNTGKGGGVYCVGFIGAAVYYISHATGFWNGVLGFLKALVWPAFLVYEALKFMLG